MPLRRRIKSLGERALVASGAAGLARRRMRGRTLVLAYHNIVPEGEPVGGDRSLHLPQRAFADQLDLLGELCDVVPLAGAFEQGGDDSLKPRAVITFDDAYRGAVRVGVRELVSRSLPATIFVAPAFVGGKTFWWDALAEPGAVGLPETLRGRALDELRGRDEEIRGWAERAGLGLEPVAEHASCAYFQELTAAAEQPGIALASHSWSHPNLTRLTEDELRHELERPLAWLRERFRGVQPFLSYPYGLSSAAVERAAAAAGYDGAFRIEGGWMAGTPADRFAAPRLNVPGALSLDGFRLRAAGLLCG